MSRPNHWVAGVVRLREDLNFHEFSYPKDQSVTDHDVEETT
jgi:hypothetical protein